MQCSYGILVCKMRVVAVFALKFLSIEVSFVLYLKLAAFNVFKYEKKEFLHSLKMSLVLEDSL